LGHDFYLNRLFVFFNDFKLIAFRYRSAMDDFCENTLSGHDTVTHFLENRASLMTFFPNLRQLKDNIIALKSCSDREFREIYTFHDQILAKSPVIYLRAPGAERVDLLLGQKTYLSVPFTRVGVVLYAKILQKLNCVTICFLCSFLLTDTCRDDFPHFESS